MKFFVNKKEQREVINQGTFQKRWWECKANKGSSKAGGGVWLLRLPAISLRCDLRTFLPFELVEANGLLNSKRKCLIEECWVRHRGGQWIVIRGLRIAQDNLTLDLQHSSFLQIGHPCTLQGNCGSCPCGTSVHTVLPTGSNQSPRNGNFFKIKRNYSNESESVSYRPKYDSVLFIWSNSEDHTIRQSPGWGLKSPPHPHNLSLKRCESDSWLEMPIL